MAQNGNHLAKDCPHPDQERRPPSWYSNHQSFFATQHLNAPFASSKRIMIVRKVAAWIFSSAALPWFRHHQVTTKWFHWSLRFRFPMMLYGWRWQNGNKRKTQNSAAKSHRASAMSRCSVSAAFTDTRARNTVS